MPLVLPGNDVEGLIDMNEVVSSVEEVFRRQRMGDVSNFMRMKSRGTAAVLNVMHVNFPYLGIAELKT